MSFEGDVVLVTGGAGGLGEATVRMLHGAGAAVVVADVADDKGAALAGELGNKVAYVHTDVLNDDDVQAAFTTADELGTLRYAVIAHGGIGVAERLLKRDGTPATIDGFKKTIDLYLTGTYNVLRLAAAKIATTEPDERGERGAIVMTASIAGYEGQIGQVAYAASKGGVLGLTLPAARDLSSLGIRVMTIAPGIVDTPMLATVSDEFRAALAEGIPFPKRLGRPEEFASLALSIIAQDYLNGEVIRMDGALRMAPR